MSIEGIDRRLTGTYRSTNVYWGVLQELRGTPSNWVTIMGETGKPKPVLDGLALTITATYSEESDSLHYFKIQDIVIQNTPLHCINVYDKEYAVPRSPVRYMELSGIEMYNSGYAGVKMARVSNFIIRNCIYKDAKCYDYPGIGFDVVCCRHGVIEDCRLINLGYKSVLNSWFSSGFMIKGGSYDITVRDCFVDYVYAACLAGQTTGADYFYPPIGALDDDGEVINWFGALTRGQKLVRSLAGEIALTPHERWTVAGRSVPKLGARDIVTGRHRYASDLSPAPFKPSEMLYGRVLRPPAIGATLASIEPANEDSLAGVVLVSDREFVGVAAKRSSQAARALEGLRPKWNLTPQPEGRELFEHLRQPPEGPREGRRGAPHVVGSVADALGRAAHRLESTYTVAYIAHVPLEPRAAVAEWKDGRLTVWTGTQRPLGVKAELAEAFHLPEQKVRVIVPDTGSGYGGKHSGECAIEAARLARTAAGPALLCGQWSGRLF